jgi:hypothetical protein
MKSNNRLENMCDTNKMGERLIKEINISITPR